MGAGGARCGRDETASSGPWLLESIEPPIARAAVLAGTAMLRPNPSCYGHRGQGGLTPCRRSAFHEEPGHTADIPLVVPALRTHRSL